MLRAKARWELKQAEEPVVAELVRQLNIPPLLARLLAVRGYSDAASAGRFLSGKEDHFHNPFLLDGMQAAVERIRFAISRGEKIRIYGDYDADGVSSTSLMIRLMRQLGASFDYVIPHRKKEGYGLNLQAIETARNDGVGLIVTVDTGITALEEAALAKNLGIDLIVTDHHEPMDTLPDTLATINPKKPGCPYPFKSLAGVGVAFKLAHALLGRLPKEYLSLAAIGTIADLMPLEDENRLIAGMGLKQMRESPSPGIRALCSVSGIECAELSAGHIGFSIAPRINAGGRLVTADSAVGCLTSDNEQEALLLAQDLDRLNRERQQIVDDIAGEAIAEAERFVSSEDSGRVLVLAGEGWNAGVIGIVASRVLERFYRPTVILSIDEETGLAKGSARSIPGFDLHAALVECADLLDHFGGHKAAAGMTIKAERIAEFRRKMNEIAADWLDEEDYVPVFRPDLEITPEEITLEAIRQLERLEPFGMGNPQPLFLLGGLRVKQSRRMGRDRQHAKLSLVPFNRETEPIDALLFGKADLADQVSPTGSLDVLAEMSVNEWNGTRKPQMVVKDLRVAGRQVFDWRGSPLDKPPVADWWRSPMEDGLRGALLFRREDVDLLPPPEALAIPLWLAGSDGKPEPLNAKAGALRPHLVQHVLLPVLPPDAEIVRNTLAAFAGAERYYAVLHDPRPWLSSADAGREAFKEVYGTLRMWSRQGPVPAGDLSARLAGRTGLTTDTIRFILAVFEQLGFLAARGTHVALQDTPAKKALDESPLYREKASRHEVERIFLFSTAMELTRFLLDDPLPESAIHSANA